MSNGSTTTTGFDLPRHIGDPSAHEMVMRALWKDYPHGGDGRRAIDVPCGAGPMSIRLRRHGFSVTCCDIDLGNFQAEDFEHIQADLNKQLPVAGEQFDLVISIAGLQRLYAPQIAIREFYRILKPGGRLYLSLPNFATLRKRIRFFLYGTLGPRFDKPKYVQTLGNSEANVRFPLMYPRVEQMVMSTGFEFENLHVRAQDTMIWTCLPLTFTAWVMARLRAMTNIDRGAAYPRSTTFGMLGSSTYLIVARKT